MKFDKTLFSITIMLSLALILGGCALKQSENTVDKKSIKVAGLKGPTTIGMIDLIDDYNFTLTGTADEIASQLIKGELDIAAVPCNLASVLFNKTEGKISVAAINTLGVLYVVETGENINSVQDLKGKTILSTGKGTTPEFALNYILKQNGIDPEKDVEIEYKSEAAEVFTAIKVSSGYPIAVLPQPYVTSAQMQMENLRVCLDLTEEWGKISNDSSMITGVVIVRNEFAQQNKEAFNTFLDDYKKSVDFVNNNVSDAAKLIEQTGIIAKAAIAEKAVPKCNIVFIEGEAMETQVNGYLNVLFEQNPNSVGGKLPDDTFYYQR